MGLFGLGKGAILPQSGNRLNVAGDGCSAILHSELSGHMEQVSKEPIGSRQDVVLAVDIRNGTQTGLGSWARAIRKAKSSLVMVILMGTDGVQDEGGLELMELFVRDTLIEQKFDGDSITVGYDSKNNPVKSEFPMPKGFPEIAAALKKWGVGRSSVVA